MYQAQDYSMSPIYGCNEWKRIGVLQHLQLLLNENATLADVAVVIQQFQQEFGLQEQLENVIQFLVGRFLEEQVATRKKRLSISPLTTH